MDVLRAPVVPNPPARAARESAPFDKGAWLFQSRGLQALPPCQRGRTQSAKQTVPVDLRQQILAWIFHKGRSARS